MRTWVTLTPPKDFDPRLVHLFQQINLNGQQTSTAIYRIGQGTAPDNTGAPLVDTTGFFRLAGRPGGQIANGSTDNGGSLVLGSTAAPTKGFIYLGNNKLSTYDEADERLGLGTTTPLARAHVVGGLAPTSVALVPTYDVNNGAHGSGDLVGVTTQGSVGGWSCFTGASQTNDVAPAFSAVNADDGDTKYIANSTSSGNLNPQAFGLSAVLSGARTWTITYSARWSSAGASAASIRFRLVLNNGQYYTSASVPVSDGSVTTSWQTYTTTISTVGAGTTGGTPNSIEVALTSSQARSFCISYISIVNISSEDVLLSGPSDGTTTLRMDGQGNVGVGTGSAPLGKKLNVQSADIVPFGVYSTATTNMTEWADATKVRATVTKDGYFTSRAFVLNDNVIGALTLQSPATITSYALTMPPAQGANHYVMANNGAGVLSWVNPNYFYSATVGSKYLGLFPHPSQATDFTLTWPVNQPGAHQLLGSAAGGSSLDWQDPTFLWGATSGYVRLLPTAVTTSYTLTLPAAQGAAGTTLQNNGAGTLTFVNPAVASSAFVFYEDSLVSYADELVWY